MPSRLAWPAVSSAALVLAGCGGRAASPPPAPPKIPRTVASSLSQQADALAAQLDGGRPCSARTQVVAFRQATLAALPRVPLRYRARLAQAVDALAARVPACPPPAPSQPHPKPKPEKSKGDEDHPEHHGHHGH
jgi:hypothetical protein